ncbi:josephin-1-like, partial [Lingula anatina]|uniref:ubiquitinyl hydrolase 1 n=1 Tax=Lingula anatina TaxID=7574 RepID=A0A1S3H881_LINAN
QARCHGASKFYIDHFNYRLSPGYFLNPHKSVLGFGNYDVNVIMAAIQTKNCETIWFDKRKDIGSLNFDKILGFILNIPTDYKWGFLRLPIHRKHWISMRKIGEVYYNLDSKLDAPEVIGTSLDLQTYLKEQMESKDKELLLVVTSDVDREESWRMPEIPKGQEKSEEMNANDTDANSNREKCTVGSGDESQCTDIVTQQGDKGDVSNDQSTVNENGVLFKYV